MAVFNFLKKDVAFKAIENELQVNPYYKRIDMPKPIYVKVDNLNSKTKMVEWHNQYTSNVLGVLDFANTHKHLESDDEILEAMELFDE